MQKSFQYRQIIMQKTVIFLIAIISIAVFSCNNATQNTSAEPTVSTGIGSSGPDAIIYKTKADFNMLVPVIMNAEKTDIVSYPAPGDLKYKGEPAIPTTLEGGFLLDNRGITENAVFLEITYEAYMALSKTPSKDELMAWIVEKDPFTVMYSCGKRAIYKNEIKELNTYIIENDFSKFKKLK